MRTETISVRLDSKLMLALRFAAAHDRRTVSSFVELAVEQTARRTEVSVDEDGKPMNANHDYVIRMKAGDLPPARAFWSFTLYDTKNGFFIPNDRKKYSVGENGGMKLAADGGLAIHIAAEKPEGVPAENWLPLNRGDYGIDVILRLYSPDLEKFKTWSPPKGEKIG